MFAEVGYDKPLGMGSFPDKAVYLIIIIRCMFPIIAMYITESTFDREREQSAIIVP